MTSETRVGQFSEFWRLLSAYEDATIQEAVALSARDFVRLDDLGEFKKVTLSQLLVLGRKNGLDRRNRELRERLDALEAAERMNGESANAMAAQIKKEVDEVSSSSRRLSSLKDAYAGDSPETAFFAEG